MPLKPKLKDGDTLEEAITKLSENNIGAGKALMSIIDASRNRKLPKEFEDLIKQLPDLEVETKQNLHRSVAEMRPLLILDQAEVHGHLVWMLYKEVCGRNPHKVCDLLDQYEKGDLSLEKLHKTIHARQPKYPKEHLRTEVLAA